MPGLRSLFVLLVSAQIGLIWSVVGHYAPTDAAGQEPGRAAPPKGGLTVWSADAPAGKVWGNESKPTISLDGPGVAGTGKAIALRFEGEGWRGCGLNWKGWFPEDSADDVTKYRSLVFHVRQTTAVPDADVTVYLVDNLKRSDDKPVGNGLSVLKEGGISRVDEEWRKVVLPLDRFAKGTDLNLSRLWGINFVNSSGKTLGFRIDRIAFTDDCPPIPKFASGAGYAATATLQVNGPTYLIRDEIYGVCDLSKDKLRAYGIPVTRWGGNRSSRFNWKANADNAGKDWYFKNGGAKAAPEDAGWTRFARDRQTVGATAYVTVPMLGWVSKDHSSYAFPVRKYGPQRATEPNHDDVGNGVRADGSLIRDNDPTDTSVPVGPGFIAEGVGLTVRHAGRTGVKYWALDNEPMLWHETHRDVRTKPLGYDELWDRTVKYAEAIRTTHPEARIAGFCSWGWTDLFYSAADEGGNNYATRPDFNAHGAVPLAEWFIRKCGEYKKATGKPLVDVFDFHWYPQAELDGKGPYLGTGSDLKFNQLRLRTTRDLWDPDYENESWVRQTGDRKPTALLRRVRAWIEKHNPGMEVCVGEYNFGGGDNISGALAQADVFGILARERADLAFIWTHPEGTQELAWKLFRDYDGAGGRFGDRAVPVTAENPDLAVYAAKRSKDAATTVVVVNKNLTGACDFKLDAAELKGNLRAWRFDQESGCKVVEVKSVAKPVDGPIALTLPAASATILVVQ
ncbi:MAG TPA: glycoside hydrolase family 44 protein [Gemmataceae bacterium]|jgi:hypothetical protein|nr:glycoside hydrolase family 44 protein [Gemmataceae bacterium]